MKTTLLPLACLALSLSAHAADNVTIAAMRAQPFHATATRAHELSGVRQVTELKAADSVDVLIALKLRNEDVLDQRVASRFSDKASALSSEQLVADHAPTDAQVALVTEYLAANGFTQIEVSANRLLVSAKALHAGLQSAFRTRLAQYVDDNGNTVRINTADVQVPAQLSGIVQAVHGLQTADQFRSMMVVAPIRKTALATAGATYHYPSEFPAIYGASTLATASKIEVGIIAQGNIAQTLADLKTFLTNNKYPSLLVNTVLVGPLSPDTSGVMEWNLDSQTILGAAGGQVKRMSFYVAPTMYNPDIIKAINAAVTANTAKVVNVSLGECEMMAKSSGMTATLDAVFKLGVAQGQVFSVATGDLGSNECSNGTTQQSYPATSPYVIAVGGTTLNTSSTGAYVSETAWAGGGGGASAVEAAPAWQVSSGVLGKATSRGVPDIAFDADPLSGAAIIYRGGLYRVGGTSLAAPIFTAFWARIMSNQTKTLPFPAASFYKYLGNASLGLRRDVLTGSNGAYKAATGWDYTTGYGSLVIGTLNTFISKNAF